MEETKGAETRRGGPVGASRTNRETWRLAGEEEKKKEGKNEETKWAGVRRGGLIGAGNQKQRLAREKRKGKRGMKRREIKSIKG